MKKLMRMSLLAVMAGVMFTACEKNENEPAGTVDNSVGNKMIDMKQLADYLTDEGVLTLAEGGNGATFIVPGNLSGFLVFKDIVTDSTGIIGGQAGQFSGTYGANDYWRENPDGTVSVKLTDNNGFASYSDFDLGEDYEGTGNMHMIFTGEKVVIQVPFPPFELVFIQPGSRGSVNMRGQGKVSLVGGNGTLHNLKVSSASTPGGQSQVSIDFN